MVKFRGIEVSIISQFDILKLPEFPYRSSSSPPDPLQGPQNADVSKSIASCYVPIYPGSQIWFEYSIDGPHPRKAAYLFKLLFDDKEIINWDCTAKHGYKGKMMYNLVCEGKNAFTGDKMIRRQVLRFGSEVEDVYQSTQRKDLMEVRIHRIAYRQRIHDLEKGLGQPQHGRNQVHLRLTNGGLLEPGFPQRRYKYQLLDPVDEPYATFRFYYRSYEHLEARGIIGTLQPSSPCSASTEWQEAEPIAQEPDIGIVTDGDKSNISSPENTPGSSPFKSSLRLVAVSADRNISGTKRPEDADVGGQNKIQCDSFLPPSDSDDSLSIITKDSIVDLPSTVQRSPNSAPKKLLGNELAMRSAEVIQSPTETRSPRRRLKKKLTINLNGVDFDDLDKKKGQLSPFTGGGVLRRMMVRDVPPSTAAANTEFESAAHQELVETWEDERESHTGAENGAARKLTRDTKRRQQFADAFGWKKGREP